MSEYKFLKYVGNKAEKPDTVARTGIKWIGKGDIKAVPMPQADRLLSHPDVWAEVDAEGNPVNGPSIPKKAESAPVASTADDKTTTGGEPGDGDTEQKPEGESDDHGDRIGGEVDPVVEAIKTAILSLDRENGDHFSEQGKPRVAAVRAAMPAGSAEVTVALLNQAWSAIEAADA